MYLRSDEHQSPIQSWNNILDFCVSGNFASNSLWDFGRLHLWHRVALRKRHPKWRKCQDAEFYPQSADRQLRCQSIWLLSTLSLLERIPPVISTLKITEILIQNLDTQRRIFPMFLNAFLNHFLLQNDTLCQLSVLIETGVHSKAPTCMRYYISLYKANWNW